MSTIYPHFYAAANTRYLLLGDRHVSLPSTDDDGYMLDWHTLEYICLRLGLEMETTGEGMCMKIRLLKPRKPPPLKVVK